MSKRRQVVQVDEEKLKLMMAGDIPIKAEMEDLILVDQTAKDTAKDAEIVEKKNDPTAEESKTETEEAVEKGRNVKKKNKRSYADIFLFKPVMNLKRQSTILLDENNYASIMRVLKITNGVSISSFLNNVLANHFENYNEEIMDAHKQYMDNLYNK